MQNHWISLVLAISLDGRLAAPNNTKAHLGGLGDRRALEEALAWSDGAIFGCETLRTHQSTCLIHSQHLIDQRVKEGRTQQPIAIVASNSSKYDLDFPFFQQPVERWLIRSSATPINKSQGVKIPAGFHRQIFFQDCWAATLSKICEVGLSRITLLGGSKLAFSFLQEDLVDELQLTFVPKLLGGVHTWIPSNMNRIPLDLYEANAWILKSSQEIGSNELLLRYFRNRPSSLIKL